MSASQITSLVAVAIACVVSATLVGCAAIGSAVPTASSTPTQTAEAPSEAFELGLDVAGVIYSTQWCAVDAAHRSLAEKVVDSAEQSFIDRDVALLRASLINLAAASTTESYVWPSETQRQIAIVGDWAAAEAAGLRPTGPNLSTFAVLSGEAKAADGAIRDLTTLARDHDGDCTWLEGSES